MANLSFFIVLTAIIINSNVAYGDYGYPAHPGEFKYAASIYYNNNRECSGAIINPRFILTAGHCITNRVVAHLMIGVGFVQVINPKIETWYAVEKTYVHPSFSRPIKNFPIANNDIGIIKLAKPLVFGSTVDSIQPAAGLNYSVCLTCTLASFRQKYITTAYPPYVDLSLRWLYVFVSRGINCVKFYPEIYRNQMCFYNPFMEIRPIHGDSGSPIACDGEVFGILNSGMPRAKGNFPGKLIAVAPYRSWIEDVVNDRI